MCLAISKGADVSKLRDPVRNRQKQTKHKIAVAKAHSNADIQKNKRKYDSGLQKQNAMQTEEKSWRRKNTWGQF